MRKLLLAATLPLALGACQTSMGSILSTAQNVCAEAQAIQAAASSPEGLAAAAQAGIGASKVSAKVASLNSKVQAYCALGSILAPAAVSIIQTASAGVLGTHAAPPALVAAAKAGG